MCSGSTTHATISKGCVVDGSHRGTQIVDVFDQQAG
jgi:hypothetical protein